MSETANGLEEIRAEFSIFLEQNPASELVELESGKKKSSYSFKIDRPWGDKTLAIFVPQDQRQRSSLAEALQDLVLPEPFSAVFHQTDELLEVLWTAYELRSSSEEVKNRKFSFNWDGAVRECHFGQSSDNVLELAKHCLPVSNESLTGHRNIVPFHFFATEVKHPTLSQPLSFWIDCKGIDVADHVEFIRHINAHMTYFDRLSPRVLIHLEVASEFSRRNRYVEGKFPSTINARKIDANLLSFWNEIFVSNNELMRFLLCYRIAEYAAFNYLDAKTRQEVRRLLSQPSLPENLEESANGLVEMLVQSKETEAIPRFQNLVSETVDLEKLWKVIELNKDYFKDDHVFEGGYEVKALLSGKCDYETWKPNGVRNTTDRLRQIRNALSHGQDGSTRGTIQPTKANSRALVPWINLIEIIAGDVMLLHKQ